MRLALAGVAAVFLGGTAVAQETVTYTYDARGRLLKVEHAGTVNNGVTTDYEYDDADNIKRKKTAGA